jgi:hypothetical protein
MVMVGQYDKFDGKLIRIWNSITQIGDEISMNRNIITRHIVRQWIFGHKQPPPPWNEFDWRFIDPSKLQMEVPYVDDGINLDKFGQFTPKGMLVRLFNTVGEIAMVRRVNYAEAHRWIYSDENMIYDGYFWKRIPYQHELGEFFRIVDGQFHISNYGTIRYWVGTPTQGFYNVKHTRGKFHRGYRRFGWGDKHYFVHRLVVETFFLNGIPLPPDQLVIHIDGNRSNNTLVNLRVVKNTPRQYRHHDVVLQN